MFHFHSSLGSGMTDPLVDTLGARLGLLENGFADNVPGC